MARRDIKGVVDFAYLEEFAAGDDTVIDDEGLWLALGSPLTRHYGGPAAGAQGRAADS